jgi:putative FmdB family regulatory protein
MPIYEYRCKSCEEELEVLQKISDAPLEKCPACGQLALKKKVSAAAFRLKGGGWYETDFKTGNKKNIAGGSEGSSPAGAGDGASAGKSDSSPAAKSGGEATGKSDSPGKTKSEGTKTA